MHPHRFFRPYGQGGNLDNRLLSQNVVDHLASRQATIVLWSALPRDWQDPDGWVDRALDQVAALPWSLMVLHDLPTGAMRHLDRFIGLIGERGGRIRQDFPPDCMPMVDGEMKSIDDYLERLILRCERSEPRRMAAKVEHAASFERSLAPPRMRG